MGKVIGILSLKGGVGKTSTVVSLGDAISRFGKKVLLVDGNMSSPSLGLHLKLVDPENTLHEVLSRKIHPRDSIHRTESFDIIPSRIFSNVKINPFDLKNKIRNLSKKYDFVLIDSSPKLDEETLAVMLASDEIFIVTTPDHPTLSTTIRAVKTAQQRGTQINGIILNKVYNKNFELDFDDIEKTVDVPILAVIPHEMDFSRALSKFTPLPSYNPNSQASQEYMRLAGVLSGEKHRPFSIRNFFYITPKREEINREIFYDNLFK